MFCVSIICNNRTLKGGMGKDQTIHILNGVVLVNLRIRRVNLLLLILTNLLLPPVRVDRLKIFRKR